jgi:hypothetical protein
MPMSWLTTALMVEPNTAAAAIACSIVADASVKVVQVCGRSARDEFVRRRIEQALLNGKLPFNHTVERAVHRAAVLAALNVLTPDRCEKAVAAADKGPQGARNKLAKAVASFEFEAKSLRFDRANKKDGRMTLEDPALKDVDVHQAVQKAIARLAGNGGTGGDPLEIAVLDRICDPREWDVEPARVQVHEHLTPFFKSTENKSSDWAKAFALHFAQELKEDSALSTFLLHLRLAWIDSKLDVIADETAERDRQAQETLAEVAGHVGPIAQAVQQLRSGIDLLVAEQTRRDEVRRQFIEQGMFIGENAPKRDGAFDRFHFRAEGFTFQGRTEEIEAIERDFLAPVDACDEAGRFRWMALCGSGGTGKSRLAQCLVDRQRAYGTFSFAGFATPELLNRKDFIAQHGHCLPAATLIVVDYAFAAAADLPAFMRRVARDTRLLRQPLRVLVVVRRSDDRVLLDIVEPPRGGDDLDLKQLEVTPTVSGAKTSGLVRSRLTLEPLGQDETVAIMRERMLSAAAGAAVRAEFDDPKYLLATLRRFDERMRPLFAGVVADALQRGQLPETDKDGSQEEARKTLFTAYMKEESLRVWHKRAQHLAPIEADACVVRHVNLVRVVTCAGGARRDDLQKSLNGKLDSDTEEALPGLGRKDGGTNIHRRLLRAIVPVADDDEIGPVQPDLLAECLLLADGKSHGSFTQPGEQGDHTNLWLSPQKAIELAWHVDPLHSAAFVRLAAQDFPMTVQNTRCLPATYNDKEAARAGARALRNICADIAADVLPRLPSVAQMMRLFDIVQAFDGSLVEWAWRDERVHEYYGDTLFQVSQIAGFVLNSNTPLADAITVVGEIETAKDKEARRTGLSRAFDRERDTQTISSLGNGSNATYGNPKRSIIDETATPASEDLIEVVLDRFPKLAERAELFVWNDRPPTETGNDVEDRPYSERERFVTALSRYYTGVFWERRDDLREGGRVGRPLSEVELAARMDARKKVLARLNAHPHFNEVATIAVLLHALIYAELGSNVSAYRDALVRVVNSIDSTQVSVRGATAVLKFASNQLISVAKVVSQRASETLSKTERSSMLADLEAADRLLVFGAEHVVGAADISRNEIKNWASALIDLHAIRTSDELRALRPCANPPGEILQIIKRFGNQMDLTPTVLNGLLHAISLAEHPIAPVHDLVERQFIDWMDNGAIDVESFRPPSVDIDGALVWLVVGTSKRPAVLTGETAQRLVEWLGAEARGATLRAIANAVDWVGSDLQSRSPVILRAALRKIRNDVGLSGEGRLGAAFLSLWARQLFDGETEAVLDDIEAFWSEGSDAEGMRSRALAMRGYALVGAMANVLPPDLERLRIRLTSSDLGMGTVGSAMSEERNLERMLDEARVEALASFAELVIRLGGDPMGWSVTGQYDQQYGGSMA